MNVRLLLAGALTLAATQVVLGSGHDTDLDAILTKAAKAAGAGSGGLDCFGTCVSHGASEKFRLAFDGPNFYDAATGSLTDIAAYDGKGCWEENWANVPHYVVLSEGDSNEMVAWVMSGEWSTPECPLTKKLDESQSKGEITLVIQPKGGQTPATLTLDSKSMLPTRLKYWTESGDENLGVLGLQELWPADVARKNVPSHDRNHRLVQY